MKTAIYAIVMTAIVSMTGIGSAWAMQLGNRLAMQDRRITIGVRNGTLIKSEARELRREHRMICRKYSVARSDGFITGYERRYLNFLLDRASRNISRLQMNQYRYTPSPYSKGHKTRHMPRSHT